MNKSSTIVSLEILHEYYIDGRCTDFEISPLPSSQKVMAGHRISFLPSDSGFRLVHTPANAEETSPATGIGDLFFILTLKTPDFIHFTSLEERNGFIHYFNSSRANPITHQVIMLEGNLFNYVPAIASSSPIVMVIRNSKNEQVYKATGKQDGLTHTFQPDLRRLDAGLHTLSLMQGSKEIQKQELYIDSSLLGKSVFGILCIQSPDLSKPVNTTISFKSSMDSWKFYIISERDSDDLLVLKDNAVKVTGNRYADLDFSFCERLIEKNVQGNRVYLFETGSMDKNDVFQPQLIPAYQENKAGLSLMRYEPFNSKSPSKDEQYFFCVDKKYWDKKKCRHVVPKGQKACNKVKLGSKVTTVVSQVPNPTLTKINKEVFIYI